MKFSALRIARMWINGSLAIWTESCRRRRRRCRRLYNLPISTRRRSPNNHQLASAGTGADAEGRRVAAGPAPVPLLCQSGGDQGLGGSVPPPGSPQKTSRDEDDWNEHAGAENRRHDDGDPETGAVLATGIGPDAGRVNADGRHGTRCRMISCRITR